MGVGGGVQFQARYEEECRMAIRRIEGEKQRGREDAESGRNIELQTVQSTGNKRPSNQISHQTEGFYMCAGDKKLPLAWLIDTVITGTRSETFPIPLVNLLPPRFKGTHMLQTVLFLQSAANSPGMKKVLPVFPLLAKTDSGVVNSSWSDCTPDQALTPPCFCYLRIKWKV